MMLTEILLIVLFLMVAVYFLDTKPKNFPPGLWGLPVIGYVPSTLSFPEQIKDLKRRFGDIASWRLGSRLMVFISDFAIIKTAFGHPNITERPNFFSFSVFSYFRNVGIVNSHGSPWTVTRRFALRHLKDFGLGKKSLESTIISEVDQLIKEVLKQEEKPMEISLALNVSVVNIIWKLVADRRYDINDKELITFQSMIEENFDLMQGPMMFLDYFPWLESILPSWFMNKVMKIQPVKFNRNAVHSFLETIIEDHKKDHVPHNPRDFIDAYLDQVEDERSNPNSIFTSDLLNLRITIGDLFVAGSETTSSTIRWMVALLANNPDVQSKVQVEIDAVVPRDRYPNLEDKDSLPYLEAMLNEVHRYASFVPLSLPHMVSEDTLIGSYVLPKGSIVMANASSCHFNPRYWEYPEKFYPEHFIDDNGKCMTKKDGFLPFSIGRRVCLGENLARMELFFFASVILQQFTIKPPPGEKIAAETDPSKPLFNHVKPYKVVFEKRP